MNNRLAQTVIEISLRERLRLALLVTLLGVLSAAGADGLARSASAPAW
jgi:hypothetical protein